MGCKENLPANQADLQKGSSGAGTRTATGQDCEVITTTVNPEAPTIPANIASIPRPDKEEAIALHVSRM